MRCSCPDGAVPCKHIAATFYLLAEAFDTDPFQLLWWRGRGRAELLDRLRNLRDGAAAEPPGAADTPGAADPPGTADTPGAADPPGAAAALADLTVPPLDPRRMWYPPVPLPSRRPAAAAPVTAPDLLLGQLSTPDSTLGGAALVDALRAAYVRFGTIE
jgi:uncharacterized Zn finger protein